MAEKSEIQGVTFEFNQPVPDTDDLRKRLLQKLQGNTGHQVPNEKVNVVISGTKVEIYNFDKGITRETIQQVAKILPAPKQQPYINFQQGSPNINLIVADLLHTDYSQ